MYLKKNQAGNVPGYSWTEDCQVIEVDDYLAEQLLNIPDGGFSEALPTEPAPEPPGEEDTPRKKGGRPALPRDEKGNIIRKTEIAE